MSELIRRPPARPRVGVFAREPLPGQAKTRLAAVLGPERAAALARAFVEDLVERLAPRFALTLFCAEPAPGPILSAIAAAHGVPLAPQVEGDLGARMAAALTALGPGGALVGSDAPTLPADLLASVIASADAAGDGGGGTGARAPARLALAPTADGGFLALATDAPAALVPLLCGPAGARWSSPHALADVVRAARAAGIATTLSTPWWDVDTPADLDVLAAHLHHAPHLARRTASILGSGGALRGF